MGTRVVTIVNNCGRSDTIKMKKFIKNQIFGRWKCTYNLWMEKKRGKTMKNNNLCTFNFCQAVNEWMCAVEIVSCYDLVVCCCLYLCCLLAFTLRSFSYFRETVFHTIDDHTIWDSSWVGIFQKPFSCAHIIYVKCLFERKVLDSFPFFFFSPPKKERTEAKQNKTKFDSIF